MNEIKSLDHEEEEEEEREEMQSPPPPASPKKAVAPLQIKLESHPIDSIPEDETAPPQSTINIS